MQTRSKWKGECEEGSSEMLLKRRGIQFLPKSGSAVRLCACRLRTSTDFSHFSPLSPLPPLSRHLSPSLFSSSP